MIGVGQLQDLIDAIKAGDTERVAALVGTDPALAATPDDGGLTPVRHALYVNQRAALDALLAADPPLDVLDLAATGRAEELRARLNDEPARANARARDGFTALHLACFFGGTDAVRILLEAGAEPNPPQDNPLSVAPLHSAAAARDREAVRLLLEAGADPNAQQQSGFTALDAAKHHDDAEMTALLLAHGATAE
jgi:ankyrin repeat protein